MPEMLTNPGTVLHGKNVQITSKNRKKRPTGSVIDASSSSPASEKGVRGPEGAPGAWPGGGDWSVKGAGGGGMSGAGATAKPAGAAVGKVMTVPQEGHLPCMP